MQDSRRILAPIMFLLPGLLLGGCGKSNTGHNTPLTCAELSDQGWASFESGDFAAAAAVFQAGATAGPSCAESFHGRGWARLKLNQLPLAVSDFNAALSQGETGAAPLAGKALALRDMDPPDFSQSRAAADSALAHEPDFVFEHDATLTARDLHLLLAQCDYALGDYALANAQVDSLGGLVQDPGSPTFEADLLIEIQRLGSLGD